MSRVAHIQLVSPPVLVFILQQQRHSPGDRYGTSDHNGDLGRSVDRRGRTRERQRADDVAQTEAHEQDGVHGDLLGVAGEVGGYPGVYEGEGRADGVGHVVADEPAGRTLVLGKECH